VNSAAAVTPSSVNNSSKLTITSRKKNVLY
jgi:hypothetical protein